MCSQKIKWRFPSSCYVLIGPATPRLLSCRLCLTCGRSVCVVALLNSLDRLICRQMQQKAPIDVADALKLLSGGKAFQSPLVRKYAVDVLRTASDEELHILLLQLVQALRYEPTTGSGAGGELMLDKSVSGAEELFEDGAVKALPSTLVAAEDDKEDSKEYSLHLLSPLGQFLVERACSSTTGRLCA